MYVLVLFYSIISATATPAPYTGTAAYHNCSVAGVKAESASHVPPRPGRKLAPKVVFFRCVKAF